MKIRRARPMRTFPRLAVLVLFLIAGVAPAANNGDFSGVCVKVLDGDSIIVATSGDRLEVRLDGIDAPEHGQAYGEEAKAATKALVLGKKVTGEFQKIDKYGRTVARIFVDGEDLSLMLVRAGAAWKYKWSSDPVLTEAQKQARKEEKGLWARPNPVPPWEWRKEHPR